jgi:hypothetical protein
MSNMREHIRLLERLINEMPITNYQMHGDFTKPGSFNDADQFSKPVGRLARKYAGFRKDAETVSNPKAIAKITKAFTRTPFPFAFHMVNVPADEHYRDQVDSAEYQQMDWTPKLLAEMFGITVTLDPKTINVVLLGNTADNRDRMSAWIVAHRFAHSLWQHNADDAVTTNDLEQGYLALRDRLETLTGEQSIAQKLFTMRSAREGRLDEPGEEMVSQFIITGKITLNRFGNPQADHLITAFETKVNHIVAAALTQCIGKLFVWF